MSVALLDLTGHTLLLFTILLLPEWDVRVGSLPDSNGHISLLFMLVSFPP